MQGKFKFSLDGADATARQFAELKRQVQELSPSIVSSVKPMVDQITAMYQEIQKLTGNLEQQVQESIDRNSYTKSEIDAKVQAWNWGVLSPDRGGTGTVNAYENLLTVGPWRAAWVLHDGTVGTAQSIREAKTNICDADEFIPVDALRRVKWQVFTMKDDENQHLNDAQPMVGMIADDLDAVGLGFFCEYDEDGTLVGINYPMLGVAALRLAQQAMDEVDRLKGEIAVVSPGEDRMGVSMSKELIVRNDS
nr:MAG: chaperone of endosialidase [Bacteriophage sp.]